jgi:hypothetical protein
VLSKVEPFVQYGLNEAKFTSYLHAMREIAAMSYLLGKGYDPKMVYQTVESWEVNETFYPGGDRLIESGFVGRLRTE